MQQRQVVDKVQVALFGADRDFVFFCEGLDECEGFELARCYGGDTCWPWVCFAAEECAGGEVEDYSRVFVK